MRNRARASCDRLGRGQVEGCRRQAVMLGQGPPARLPEFPNFHRFSGISCSSNDDGIIRRFRLLPLIRALAPRHVIRPCSVLHLTDRRARNVPIERWSHATPAWGRIGESRISVPQKGIGRLLKFASRHRYPRLGGFLGLACDGSSGGPPIPKPRNKPAIYR